MQIEAQSNLKNLTIVSLKEKPGWMKLQCHSNLLGLIAHKKLVVYRIELGFHKIFEFEEKNLQNNEKIIDFNFSPTSQKICLAFEKGKIICLNIEEPDNEKRQLHLFANSSQACSLIKWVESTKRIHSWFDCFRLINEDSRPSNNRNYFYDYVKPSFSHVFADKANLLRIQSLEDLIDRRETISILSVVENLRTLRLAFNGVLEFGEIDLAKICPMENLVRLEYCWLDQFKTLLTASLNGDRSSCTLSVGWTNTHQFEFYMREIFAVSWILANIKESDANLKLGVFKSRTVLKTQKDVLLNWFPESIRLNPNLHTDIKHLAEFGSTKSEELFNFLKELDIKAMFNANESIGKFLKSLFEFFLECVYSQYQRMGAYVRELRQVNEQLTQKGVCVLPVNELLDLENLIVAALQTTEIVIDKINRKKLQLRNFFLFCFKAKFKLANKLRDGSEHKELHEAIVDFGLLFEFLNTRESLFMDDLNAEYNNICLLNNKPQNQHVFNLPESTENALAELLQEINVPMPLTPTIPNIKLGFSQIVNEISGKLKIVAAFFVNHFLLIDNFKKTVQLNFNLNDDLVFSCVSQNEEDAYVGYLHQNSFYVHCLNSKSEHSTQIYRVKNDLGFSNWIGFNMTFPVKVLFQEFEKDLNCHRIFYHEFEAKQNNEQKQIEVTAKFEMTTFLPDVSQVIWNQANIVVFNGMNSVAIAERIR